MHSSPSATNIELKHRGGAGPSYGASLGMRHPRSEPVCKKTVQGEFMPDPVAPGTKVTLVAGGPDLTIRHVGAGALELLGYPDGTLMGTSLSDLVNADDLSAGLGDAGSGSTVTDVTGRPGLRVRHKDGSWRVLAGQVTDLRDDSFVQGVIVNLEQPAPLAGVPHGGAEDIPSIEQLMAEEDDLPPDAVRQRYERMVEMTRDAYVEIDATGVVSAWNNRAETLSGWTSDEAVGRKMADLVVLPRNRAAHRRELAALVEAGEGGRPRHVAELPIRGKDGESLVVAVTTWVTGEGPSLRIAMLAQDVSRQRAAEDALAHAYNHDALTGLPNRSQFTYRLRIALKNTNGEPGTVAVLAFNADRFKAINDSLGHEAGDELLIGLANRIGDLAGPDCLVARLGADSFLVLHQGDDAEKQAQDLATRLLASLKTPFLVRGEEVFLAASIGIAAVGESLIDATELLSSADAAMGRAKKRGGATVEVFGESMRIRVSERMNTESSLHRALDREEFRVFYQPVVDIRSTDAVAVEALVRWFHPERGLVGPDKFIPVAEESGLIVPIGAWVLEESVRKLQAWGEGAGPRLSDMKVNLSARQIDQPEIVATVDEVLSNSSIDPEKLTLEITESALMNNADLALDVLKALKDLGVTLAIDDFGTGYSSLAYLRRFPLDILKVDKSFVDEIATNVEGKAIVSSIINLAHTLDMRVIAEGVETEQQLDELRRMGCDLAQGYLFSRPLPEDELTGRYGPKD